MSEHRDVLSIQRAGLQLCDEVVRRACCSPDPSQAQATVSFKVFTSVLHCLHRHRNDPNICFSCYSILGNLAVQVLLTTLLLLHYCYCCSTHYFLHYKSFKPFLII
jgi:hypothetical protein